MGRFLAPNAANGRRIEMWQQQVSVELNNINMSLVRAYLSANQAINHNTATTVAGYTESFDIGGNFNATTGLYTAPVSGYYHFDATIMFYDASAQLIYAAVYVYKNSSLVSIGPYWWGSGGTYVGGSASDTIQLAAGDTLKMAGWMQTNDSGAAVMYAGSYTHFSVHLLSKV